MTDAYSDDTVGEVDDVDAEAPAEPTPAELAAKIERLNKALSQARYSKKENDREIKALRELIEMRNAEPQTRAEKTAEPDPDEDPMAWIKYARDRLRQFDSQAEAEERTAKERDQQSAEVTKIVRQMGEYEDEFRAENDDYDQAVDHFKKAYAKELREEGISAADLDGELRSKIFSTVARAIKAGKDPAEVMYKLAKNRGWKKPSTQETDVDDEKLDKNERKIQTIEKGQQAGRSLSTGSARQGDGQLTWSYVSTLKGKAFSDAVGRLKDQAKRAGAYR
jgi:hypothetical protein